MTELQFEQIASLISADKHQAIANMANLSSWIYNTLENINWAGFYLWTGKELVLGPFSGKIACTTIKIGKGVCGTALEQNKSQLVPDVHTFPGHIACDTASNSELVVPLYIGDKPIGVLDIDSPILNRFDTEHQTFFEKVSKCLMNACGVEIAKLVGNM